MHRDSLFCRDTAFRLPSDPADCTPGSFIAYQADVVLPAGKQAILRFCAASPASIYLNGEFLHFGPCRSKLPILYYDEIVLCCGGKLEIKQCLEINLEPGIILEVEYPDGSFALQSPDNLAVRRMTEYAAGGRNFGTGFRESLSLRPLTPQFQPAVAGTVKIPPGNFRPRPVPYFTGQPQLPLARIEEAPGVYTFDFGTMVLGFCEISGNAFGAVTLEYIEARQGGWISPRSTDVMYTDDLRDANGPFHCRLLHKRAFRHVRVRGATACPDLRVIGYNYPLTPIGSFKSSDPMLNRLAEISADTLAVCMDDIYNDCPHRDQAQWMDALAAARIALGQGGVTDLTKKCIEQYTLCSLRDGKVVSPSITGVTSFVDYTLLLFRFVEWYYRCTGDRGLTDELYSPLATILAGFQQYERGDRLLDYPRLPGSIVYLDNTFELPKNGVSTALNALYAGALMSLANLAEVTGRRREASRWRTRAKQVQTALQTSCKHPSVAGCFRDNLKYRRQTFYLVNFSCELEHWSGHTGLLEFSLDAGETKKITLVYAAYAGVRLLLNGEPVLDDRQAATWQDQPVYQARRRQLSLRPGRNHLRFEVDANELNWELFFRFTGKVTPQNTTVAEFSPATGEILTMPKSLRLRHWRPPTLSQSTQAYAAFADISPPGASLGQMLRKSLVKDYSRTYLSVRVPYFCTEAQADREEKPWILPANTPWSTFFLLDGLFENNCEEQALALIRHHWGPMLKAGAVNTWEEWGDRSSLCHAWGAVPLYYFMRNILGIRHDTWHKGYIEIRPQLFDLTFAQGSVALADGGRVNLSLKRCNNTIELTVQAPPEVPVRLETYLLPGCMITPESHYTSSN